MKSSSKTKSFDLINYPFDSKLKGEWGGELVNYFKFIEVYIQKKYKDIVHYLPFIELGLSETCTLNNKGDKYIYDKKFEIMDFNRFIGYDISTHEPEILVIINKIKERYKNTKKRFTFYTVGQAEFDCENIRRNGHSMLFLYDTQDNTVELFNSIQDDFYSYKNKISNFFKDIYGKNVKIIYPTKLMCQLAKIFNLKCPETQFLYKSKGYCVIFTFWYLELRLTNKNLDRNQVIQKAINLFKHKYNQQICKTVMGYAQFIQKTVQNYTILTGRNGEFIMVVNKNKIIIPAVLLGILGISGSILFILKKLKFI